MLRKDFKKYTLSLDSSPKVKKYTLSLDSSPKVKEIYLKLRKYAEGKKVS